MAEIPDLPEDKSLGNTPPAALDYEVLRLIGRGGYGEVWLVRDKEGRHLACKVIYRVSFEHDRPYEREYEGIQKFEPVSRVNESQLNILHVGRRDEAGYFYYIMELADDVAAGRQIQPEHYAPKTLSSELRRRERIPVGESIRIGLSLSAALENLHEHGLIHRDIKPANIVFVNGIPKLADIGLVSDRDVTVSYVGTEGFIPPEGPGSAQADIYGLGKVLYEMSTGKDRLDFPELPADLGAEADRNALLELNSVMVKACDRDIRARYRTAGELHADLTLLHSGKSLRDRKRNEQRRRALAWLGLSVLLTTLILAAGHTGWQKWQRRGEVSVPLPDALVAGGSYQRTTQTSAELAKVCIRTGFEAFGLDDYLRATGLGNTALTAAQSAHNVHLITEAEFLKSEIARCVGAYQEIVPQVALLAKTPDDPKANLAVGKFLCLMKNDWPAGLPMLARGDNEALRAVAEQELKQVAETNLGDAWWNLAERATGGDKIGFQHRARHWYLRAIARAKEPDKGELRQKLEERIKSGPSPLAELHILSRVGNAQHIDIYADEVRWKSDGVSLNDRINHILMGDLKGKSARTVKNSGATRLFPEWVDFSTAQLTVDRKGKKRGKATMQIAEDHVRVNLTDKPAGTSELEVTVTFGARP